MRVVVIAMNNVLDSSLALTLDVLQTAERVCRVQQRAKSVRVDVRSAQRLRIRMGSGRNFETDGLLSDRAVRADVVIIPGWNTRDQVSLNATLGSAEASEVRRFLQHAHTKGATIAASCSATFLLAQSGVLDGGVATTTWWLAPVFRARFPQVELESDRTLVKFGRVYTAGAALSIVDLVLALVTQFVGANVAKLCARYLAIESHPSQARFMLADHLVRHSTEVARAENWIRKHMGSSISVTSLARAARTSSRTLARRVHNATGMTLTRFIQRLRAEQAVHLLETTRLSFDEVTRRVGYVEPSTLRRILKRETGRGPREIRASTR